ncbi:MAG: response regulator [Planctomycetota bacterium]
MAPLVFVIDDSTTILKLARSVLEGAGYRVETSTNPILVAYELRRSKPDLILLDVQMPTLKGTEVLDSLQRHGCALGTPVAFFSSLTEPELAALAARHRATGWIRKGSPLSPEDLLREVERLLGRARPDEQADALVVDDSRTMRRILTAILGEAGFKVAQAANGGEALERLHGRLRVALVDLHMPEVDGQALVTRIREDPAYEELKILMVSSETDQDRIRDLLAAGVDEFVLKPFEREAILERLRVLGLLDACV